MLKLTRTAWLVVPVILALSACGRPEPEQAVSAPAPAAPAPGLQLSEIVVGDHRSEQNIARNPYRHPVETLEFFGIRPDMTVAEIWPAGGWYTEVIAPYLNKNGKYVAAHWDPESDVEFIRNGVVAYKEKLAARPDLYGNVEMSVLMYPDTMELAPPDSLDGIVTFRNIHNWMARDFAGDMFALMYEALKPGGILGVVEHRGDPAVVQDPKAASGYVNEDYAIELAEAAGFVLAGKSEINANPADTKDYEKGVWTLPPTMRAGEENRDRYIAIGESDRFTLKFVKPQG